MAAVLVFAALMVSLSRLLTPFLNEHRVDIETWASKMLNVPVTVSEIYVSWNYYEPQLAFKHVIILDQKTQKPNFQIREVVIDFSIWRSLFHWQLLAERINIVGVHVTLHAQPSGKVKLEGVGDFAVTDDLTGASMGAADVAGWVFAQPHLRLDDIDIVYVPLQGASQSVTLNKLSLNNSGADHFLSGDAILNQSVPTAAKVGLKWRGDVREPDKISAHLYLYLKAVSLPQWFSKQTWHNLKIKQGLGSIKVWADWDHRQLQKVQTQFQVYALELQSLITQKTQLVSRISGHIGWKRDGNKQVFAGEDILVDFSQHLWPTTGFSAVLVPQDEGSLALESLQVNYLDLTETKEIVVASGLLPADIEKLILALNPVGNVHAFEIDLRQPLTTFKDVTLAGQFYGLSFNAYARLPGITNITGELRWDGQQGAMDLNSRETTVAFADIFANPIQLDQLIGHLHWHCDSKETWVLQADNIRGMNADINVQMHMTMTVPKKESPTIDLKSDFTVNNAAHFAHYLPLKTFEPDFVTWLTHAFQQGQLVSGKAILNGHLSDFPFDKGTGQFEVSGEVRNLEFLFAPGWPMIHKMNGSVIFAGRKVAIDLKTGYLQETELNNIHGEIPYIGDAAPQILLVKGSVAGDLNHALDFIHDSPLEAKLGKDLAGMDLAGPMELKLNLSVPLRRPEKAKVQADVSVTQASLNLPAWNINLEKIQGDFQFTQDLIRASNLRGNVFEQPFTLNLSTYPAKGSQAGFVKAVLESQLSIAALEKISDLPLGRYASGRAPVSVEVHLVSHERAEPTQVIITSNLKGVAIDLPDPYGKQQAVVKNLNVNLEIAQQGLSQAKVNYANFLNAVINYRKYKEARSLVVRLNSQTLRGEVAFPLRESTEPINARFQYVDIPNVSQDHKSLFNPNVLPAFIFSGDEVRYDNKNIGRVFINAIPSQNGLVIKALRLDSAFMKLSSSGDWQLQGKTYHTRLRGQVTTLNMSKLLEHWGTKSPNLVGSGGTVAFDLVWPDAPYSPTLQGMSGDVNITLTPGRIVDLSSSTDTKIGIGRLLNIFSLQSIPRRLSLDFSDLFNQGYSFDSMQGNFKLQNGNAVTESTRFDGPVARVEIRGRVGVTAKDFNMKLNVTPYVTSSLPVVATIAGGPLAGVAAWFVDKVVSREVSKVTTYHYSITGSWDKPVWSELDQPAAPRQQKK